jgi:uncharacterized membrane protein
MLERIRILVDELREQYEEWKRVVIEFVAEGGWRRSLPTMAIYMDMIESWFRRFSFKKIYGKTGYSLSDCDISITWTGAVKKALWYRLFTMIIVTLAIVAIGGTLQTATTLAVIDMIMRSCLYVIFEKMWHQQSVTLEFHE